MKLIAAVDRHWGIGRQGQLLVSIPHDHKRFREMTLGKIVVMGRKTLESLPGGRPLYGRKTVVLSRQEYAVRGALVCHSVEEALLELSKYPSEDVCIVGGESIYRQFLPYCDQAQITWIDFSYEADAHCPDLEREGWELEWESEEQTYFDLCYTYRTYVRMQTDGSLEGSQREKRRGGLLA